MILPYALTPRPTTALDTIHEVLGTLAGHPKSARRNR